jgi:hypothetical protein
MRSIIYSTTQNQLEYPPALASRRAVISRNSDDKMDYMSAS